jgi:hypothetical protein
MIGIDQYVKLMLHMNGADGSQVFTDSSLAPLTVTANGNAQIDTAQSVFGGASGLLTTYLDYLTLPGTIDFEFNANDFTIDFRHKSATASPTYQVYFLYKEVSGNGWWLYREGNRLYFRWRDSGVTKAEYYTTDTLTWGTDWHHIAVIRNGTNFYIAFDGVLQALTTVTAISTNSLNNINTTLYFGHYPGYSWAINGWLDELRISSGIARWTSDFTVPDSEYTEPIPIEINPSLEWVLIGENSLAPSLEWVTALEKSLAPSLEWTVAPEIKLLPNIVNYPFYFSIPSIQINSVPLLLSGCPVGVSFYLKDTGSVGQTIIKIYGGTNLLTTKTILADGLEHNSVEYFPIDTILYATDKLSIEVDEVAMDAEDLKVNLYLMTFDDILSVKTYKNYYGNKLIHSQNSDYLFLSADYWTIDFNQPISSIISIKSVSDGIETDLTAVIENGNYCDNRIKITPIQTIPDSLRIILTNIRGEKFTFELEPNFQENTLQVPDYITPQELSLDYGSNLATGGTADADTEALGFEADKAFDGNPSTYWKSTDSEAFLMYSLSGTKQIEKIAVTPYMATGHSTVERWILCGSNEASPNISNEAHWSYITGGKLIDSASEQSFTFDNSKTYLHYRLTVLDNYASTNYTGIYSLTFFEKDVILNTVSNLYSYIPLFYYQYSHDGVIWSDLETFNTNFLNIDFSGISSGDRTIYLRLYQGNSYFEETIQLYYSADILDCSLIFDGENLTFDYSDFIPFSKVDLYVDDELYSTISPTIANGFETATFDSLSTLTVSDGIFYYQGNTYTWEAASIALSSLSVSDGKTYIAFGFDTLTLSFSLKARLENEQYANFYAIVEGQVSINGGDIYYVSSEPEYIFIVDSYPLSLDEDAALEIIFSDVTGRTRSFNLNYVKTFYNVWRTLTVTDDADAIVLPGQIHSETSLTYTIETDEA